MILIAVYLGVNLGLPDPTLLTKLFQQSFNRQAINSSSKTVSTRAETREIHNQEFINITNIIGKKSKLITRFDSKKTHAN